MGSIILVKDRRLKIPNDTEFPNDTAASWWFQQSECMYFKGKHNWKSKIAHIDWLCITWLHANPPPPK